MRNISVNNLKFGPVVQEILQKDIFYLELWQSFCAMEPYAILVEGIIRNISVKQLYIWTSDSDV